MYIYIYVYVYIFAPGIRVVGFPPWYPPLICAHMRFEASAAAPHLLSPPCALIRSGFGLWDCFNEATSSFVFYADGSDESFSYLP